jgi:hypothetical protein
VAKKKSQKSQRRRKAPPGVDVNEQRRQRLEARRQARVEAMQARLRAERRQRLIRWVVTGLLVAALVWFLILRTQRPTVIAGHKLELLSESGSGRHVSTQVNYPTTPPVSGEHAAQPTACGRFDQTPPDENLVHTLEHGAIGLFFDPEQATRADIERLEGVVDDYPSHIFSAPYEQMPTPFVIASWGEMMRLEQLDLPAVREYVETFREKGPEDQPCDKSVDRAYQPPEEEPSPSPSPSPDQQGGDKKGGGKGDKKGGND